MEILHLENWDNVTGQVIRVKGPRRHNLFPVEIEGVNQFV